MSVDAVYGLIIEYLIQGYPIHLEHYNIPNYQANGHNSEVNRMFVEITYKGATLAWDDFKGGHGTAFWDHKVIFDKYDC